MASIRQNKARVAEARAHMTQGSGLDDDALHGSATRRMAQLPGLLSGTAIEAPGRTLSEPDLRATLEAPDRLVPTTTGGHLADLVDRGSGRRRRGRSRRRKACCRRLARRGR